MTKVEGHFDNNKETYTVIFALLAFLISIGSYYQGCQNTEYVRKQLEYTQLASWQFERLYSNNNVDLISLTLKSRLTDITVKKMVVFPPSDLKENDSFEIIGDTWTTYPFLSKLNETISSYYDVPDSNPYANYSKTTRYPFAVKIEYWQNNEGKTSTCLFMLHLKIFNKEKVKVFGIEPISVLESLEEKAIVKEVDEVNKNAGILADVLSIKSFPNIYNKVGDILELSKNVALHQIVVLDKYLKFERYDTAYMPRFTTDFVKRDSLTTALNLLTNNLNIFPEKLKTNILNASFFIDTHPLLEDSGDENAFVINSSWRSKKTFYEWLKIVWELQKLLCFELDNKYKLTNCDTTALNIGYDKYIKSLNIIETK